MTDPTDWPADGMGGCQARTVQGTKCTLQYKHDGEPHRFCKRAPHGGYCTDECFEQPRLRQPPAPFWLVWRPAGGAPAVRHPTEASALNEASRLARLHPGEQCFVLGIEKSDVHVTRLWVDTPF